MREKGKSLEDEDLRENVPAIDDFLCIMDMDWTNDVARKVRGCVEERKWNAPQLLPLAEDIQANTAYLQQRNSEIRKALEENRPGSYDELTQVCLVRTLTLNRRRIGAVQFFKLEDFRRGLNMEDHSEVLNRLSESEKALTKSLKRLEVRGMRGRGVPVILTEDLPSSIEMLIARRSSHGIPDTNPYLFATKSHQDSHYTAGVVLKNIAIKAGAKCPENICGTKLRKHVATMVQILNLRENELDSVATYMGHDIHAHRQYYRQPEEATQLAKDSKMLLLMEKGNIRGLTNKNLDEIEVNEDVDEEESEEEDELEGDEFEEHPKRVRKNTRKQKCKEPASGRTRILGGRTQKGRKLKTSSKKILHSNRKRQSLCLREALTDQLRS